MEAFLRAFGAAYRGKSEVRVYLYGGATALLHGWRETTIDVDLDVSDEEVLRPVQRLKEEIGVNVEYESPANFLPRLPGWQERACYIDTHGKIAFYHYDPYSQFLSKIERAHARDLLDAKRFLEDGLVDPDRALKLWETVQGELYRYPSVSYERVREGIERIR